MFHDFRLTIKITISLFILLSTQLMAYQIKISGSSTLYPFISLAAERFHQKNANIQSPVVESVGTGSGIKAFCSHSGSFAPDIVNASRKISKEEVSLCNSNGITDIIELPVGMDAIVLIIPQKLQSFNLTKEQLYLALAEKVPSSSGSLVNNPYHKWSDIDANLPDVKIKVMGPPDTSGTRDAFMELAFQPGCEVATKDLKLSKQQQNYVCNIIRRDGPWVDAGENDVLMLEKVRKSEHLVGIIGYSYYKNYANKVGFIKINGYAPNNQSISNQSYPLLRSLYLYMNSEVLYNVADIKSLVLEILSDNAVGDSGYLTNIGLIPFSEAKYKELKQMVGQNK